jgi:hypothetical protein
VTAPSVGLCVEGANVTDPVAAPVMSAVLDAVAAVYGQADNVPQPCAWGMFSGQAAALDRGGDCSAEPPCQGMAWVRLVNVYPSERFPEPYGLPWRGDMSYAVVVEVGVARPAPQITEANGEQFVPTMDEETAAAALQVTDVAIVRQALLNEYAENQDVGIVLGQVVPFGPEGNVVGAVTTATVQVP